MKKIISLISILLLCAANLSSCIQITAPAPQQQVAPVPETVVQQTQAAVPETVSTPIETQVVPQAQATQPVQTAPAVPPVQAIPPVQGGYAMPQFAITIDQAKQTALNAVGMNASNVTFTKQKQDYDDGMPEYEIEFVANNMKYEFEISGVNGTILKQEIESIYD